MHLNTILLNAPKYKLPTKYKGVKFPDGWTKTPIYKRIVEPNMVKQAALNVPSLTWKDVMSSIELRTHSAEFTPKTYASAFDYIHREQDPIRYTPRLVFPTTFAEGVTIESYKKSLLVQEAPLIINETNFPYTYYQLTLKRGLIGLGAKLKSVAVLLGLRVLGQVVYIRVSRKSARNILLIKELVELKLVNSIPPCYKAIDGFKVVGNLFKAA